MTLPDIPRRIGLPLAMQMIAVLVCALLAAQLVTLALTVLLPPSPTARWDMDEVAAALNSGELPRRLERREMEGPPDVSGQGWLVSESSREALAKRLGQPAQDVVLAFYTQLPVGGVAVPASSHSPLAVQTSHSYGLGSLLVDTARAQSIPGGPPPGGATGPAGMPGGGFPGGLPPGGPVPRGPSMPGGAMPRTGMPTRGMPQAPGGPGAGGTGQAGGAASVPSGPSQTSGAAGEGTPSQPGGNPPTGAAPNGGPMGGSIGNPGGAAETPQGGLPPAMAGMPAGAGIPAGGVVPVLSGANDLHRIAEPRAIGSPGPAPAPAPIGAPKAVTPFAQPLATAPAPNGASAATEAPGSAAFQGIPAAAGKPQPVPFRRVRDSLFDLASPPFIEGDFVAAARQPDGNWLAVAPRAEPFPNTWQKRVMLWFALSLAVVSPLAWLFVRRIVLPLRDFAQAAEQLGRDPSATILPLSGPAEIGRAANAFNQMRNRLRAFVDDRTAMVGAISHDLRTPLTRLRFRIEDVPDEQREGLLKEVTEMEAMISEVIAFIRDASTPGPRERFDFADLIAGSVADARLVGADVEIEHNAHIPVDVDAVGIRRLLGNLLENAIKYGERARVRVSLAGGEAIAEILDAGPGIPEDEFDRAFEPFYRSESARKSGQKGSGLGLAVCRSIARAHGGDVSFIHARDGFVARVTVPAAFDKTLRKAA